MFRRRVAMLLMLLVVLPGICPAQSRRTLPESLPEQLVLPAGVTIMVAPEHAIAAGEIPEGEPLLFTVTEDVRLFPGTPVLIPRSSKITAVMGDSRKAGRFVGRASMEISFRELLTPSWSAYPVNARVVALKKYQVRENRIIGRGHAKRDTAFMLFPPFTLFQLMAVPARGPRLALKEEQLLMIKLMQPLVFERDAVVPRVANRPETPAPRSEAAVPAEPLPLVGNAPASYSRVQGLTSRQTEILQTAGWLGYVEKNVDVVRCLDSEFFRTNTVPGGKALGRAVYQNGLRVAEIAARGRDDASIAWTVVHEAVHLEAVTRTGRFDYSNEPYAEIMASRFLKDHAAAQERNRR